MIAGSRSEDGSGGVGASSVDVFPTHVGVIMLGATIAALLYALAEQR
ncbi:hypothetical protein LI90_386 [Carbonactinospora thermoautotrophica]|uniref:Uncharacterized protein n=1 Tax=Carbonactinospora thermoautotrophica TaxID=1469144 RepID=A0A132MLL8_9ACTN|nr:hypothetical protein [Carbonactinospora thermoautotrophica]KWW98757.1 hypothetical protein LI90_386 [Carbonactinospora thermoautotrophica]